MRYPIHLILLILIVFTLPGVSAAQPDALQYTFRIGLNDTTDMIQGEATVMVRFPEKTTAVQLDLVSKNDTGRGMTVLSVTCNGSPAAFTQQNNLLVITTSANPGDSIACQIRYEGIPADGLIISKNKYGHRTIFADNWPDRAHHWLPCFDLPADKAPVEFVVTAPAHYQVVSNGLQLEAALLGNNLKRTHWRETVALPTKVMVIGVADFATDHAGDVDGIQVYSWVYPEDREKGFYDYAIARNILPWFISNIGPYPYRKLANVQSKTMFGGMENASAIFYFENSVRGTRLIEPLIAHEIAHQWFGNSVTEQSWPHVWLSEGFATYLTQLYLEATYGADTVRKRMKVDRDQVVDFSKKNFRPVVDTSVHADFIRLLNANSYQKGGWVLHMLRGKMGDSLFRKGLRSYYSAYAGRNATTEDFRKVMEATCGKNLAPFFHQWLYLPGQPDLGVTWNYNNSKKRVELTIIQRQDSVFAFPLTIRITGPKKQLTKTISVARRESVVKIPFTDMADNLILDPGTHLLFTWTVTRKDGTK